jgi:predicted glycosyltransferase
MKVWIEVLTPKQALFFEPLYRALKARGHEALITTRVYREAEQTLGLKKLRFSVVGSHGGGTTFGKLIASAERITKLANLIQKWKPSVAVSFSSVEASRVAFGLGIPHVAANDSPHSWMVARLTIPLTNFLCCPWIIGRSVWKEFGGPMRKVVLYRALDPAAWLKRHHPNDSVLRQLGLKKDRPIVVFRTEEAFASYLMGKASDKEPVVGPIIDELLRRGPECQVVVSTRYGMQAPVIRKRFGEKVTVVDRIVDATSLLSYSSAFVGSGGTMTVEAALLGIPSISCFPGPKPLYIQYLERLGVVKTIRSPREITTNIQRILNEPEAFESQKKKGKQLLAKMEDPVAKILSAVELAGKERGH